MNNKKIVCLGGGIGTVNLIKGLKDYTDGISVVVSMADNGGSSGRLRRLYRIFPPGDMVSCMSAAIRSTNPKLSKLLTYRFPGNRYGKDNELGGQKLGNLIMAAMANMHQDTDSAIELFKNTFNIPGIFLPATKNKVSISAKTIEGKMIYGEEKIDLGKYNGKRILEKVYLHPKNAKTTQSVIDALKSADTIIAGPGDLYTTILPVLIIPEIKEILKESQANKIFIVNIANKPFETKGYDVFDFINAIYKHLGFFPFEKVIVNNNFSITIPKNYHYKHVLIQNSHLSLKISDADTSNLEIIENDLVDENFPLYHSSDKLSKVISKYI